jgi:hypothetical protein
VRGLPNTNSAEKMPVWRACNLTSFSSCLTSPVDYPFASRHKGPGFKSPGGYLCETWIPLLALSRYTSIILRCSPETKKDPRQVCLPITAH